MMIALATGAVGLALGLRFKAFVLVPAAVVSWFVSCCIGMIYGDAFWSILFAAFLAGTALQVGYLAGIVIYFSVERVRARRQTSIVAVQNRITEGQGAL